MGTDDESLLVRKLSQVREQITLLQELAVDLERAIESERRIGTTLTKKLTPVNVNKPVTEEHKFNISKGQKRGDKFLEAITAKGFVQGTLAGALGVTPALLSMYRNGKRPIPRARAERIAELTGFKATLANWPGGIVS